MEWWDGRSNVLLVFDGLLKDTMSMFKNLSSNQVLQRTLLVPVLVGRDRWISEFQSSLVYKLSSRPARVT